MNKQPVYYLQTDTRWASKPYRVPGESATIGGSGCGPTAAAMLIETLTGKTFTPVDAGNWSMEHGYKALNQGTYYSYFKPQFAAFGIDCDQLSWVNTYGKPAHSNHTKMVEMLKEGYYFIALMGRGQWTSSGHFVVVWWADDVIHINDPASTKSYRLNGDPYTFYSQVKYYWWVDARDYNKEDDDVLTQDQFNAMAEQWLNSKAAGQATADWETTAIATAKELGVSDGERPKALTNRVESMAMCNAAIKAAIKQLKEELAGD